MISKIESLNGIAVFMKNWFSHKNRENEPNNVLILLKFCQNNMSSILEIYIHMYITFTYRIK